MRHDPSPVPKQDRPAPAARQRDLGHWQGSRQPLLMTHVKEGALQLWDGDLWINVPRGAQFKNGSGGNLFEYEDD